MTAVEAQVVARVADDYRRRGYEVEVQPPSNLVPEFLRDFRPDLIARKPGDSVVVEIKVGTRTSAAEQLREVAARVSQEPGWRLSLVYADPERPEQIVEAQPPPVAVIQERVGNADALIATGQSEAAFLLLWSALEGVLRVLAQQAQLPLASLPTSTLIRELYSAGEISREQFDTLLELVPVRNQLIHGLGLDGSEPDTRRLRRVVGALLEELRNNGMEQVPSD